MNDDEENLREIDTEDSDIELRPQRTRAAMKLGLHSRLKDSVPFKGKAFDFTKFFWLLLSLAVVLSGFDIFNRMKIERDRRVVGMVTEYRDIVLLSRQTGESPESTWDRVRDTGIVGICASELTGKDLSAGFLPLYYGSLATFKPILQFALTLPLDRAALLVENSEPMSGLIIDFLRTRNKGVVTLTTAQGTLIVMPQATDELTEAGILPDFNALFFAEKSGVQVVYRPQPSPGVDGDRTADGIKWLKEKFPAISCVLPAGPIVSGYPDLTPLIRVLKELNLPVAQAEFVRQIGVSELYAGAVPSLIPLHGIVREELISRRFSRAQIIERMVRAVHERSVRLLLLRPYELYSVNKLAPFLEDSRIIREDLESRGYALGWPETIPMFYPSAGSSLGVALLFFACLWSFARRFLNYSDDTAFSEIALVLAGAAVLGISAWKITFVSKALGGFATALLAAEATLWALDSYEKPVYSLLAGLFITIAGGIAIASFYGTTKAMLRLTPFSGVKLTLLLPPLLIAANDLKLRVHPESFSEIAKRPPLWGELMLAGCALCAVVIITIRSDNASFVPAWEIRFRDFLERLMWVRPRTKEFLVGYPCLIVYYVLERRGWLPDYREIFRIGASVAFASAVNSFCHFHTMFILSVIRVVNGWALGVVIGFAALVLMDYVGCPFWKRLSRLFA